MCSIKTDACALLIILLIIGSLLPSAAATSPSIPIYGRQSALTIKIYVPTAPNWAHGVVLTAMTVWNRAQQVWARENHLTSPFYTFVETDYGSATSIVSFSMPTGLASIAVGWTNYKYANNHTSIIGTETYLTPIIFGASQGGNVTAEHYAFWLALHELGRILGLGSILGGNDIMDPIYSPQRIMETPVLSTLDLYALHVLATGLAPQCVTLPTALVDQFMSVTMFSLG